MLGHINGAGTECRYRSLLSPLCLSFLHRYKLFLANQVTDTFLNIGDGSGHGQDHCELVGGTEADANLPSDFWNTPSVSGK